MPLRIPDELPATKILQDENIFCMTDSFAAHQDIRPLRVLLLNLMPKKIETEIHLMRMLSNSPLQVNIELMHIGEKKSKNTPIEHMESFYKTFDDIKTEKYDGMIITGAPLGQVPFAEVLFWDELVEIMDWTLQHVTSVMYLCWGVQASMYHRYGIQKKVLDKKISGVYDHRVIAPLAPVIRGFDDTFDAPHSRFAEVPPEEIEKNEELEIIAVSDVAGPYIVGRKDGRELFVTGHAEYEPLSLKSEYERDLDTGMNPPMPENYFPDDDPTRQPIVTWKSHGNLLFANWLNYYVYQLTPFDASLIGSNR
ncbi:homoserine O-succinyltransferase [Pseudomonadales bacterium]|jgi:homoserine O-succinyltransferase|nr:homoserine O-succinyltransferase [Pseudomonadales bacterium]MDB2449919.1 homoserine O-succinyltransferase [Pseudomonadales bacterium]MDC1083939.1 homoserine O-succinyltransferase [Pseudomonadales bacterium]MDG1909324.1 homoserine O-succinyltransferase [Pseudomonadales bacterium]|tara:strand:+ start:735 stop:1661 length:927 start_codon:yes stop_codon:yes gene_type:complete